MKQEIIQILDDIAKESIESFGESIGTDVYPTWISTAKERIQTLGDGWIPVTDRLPELFNDVLVFGDGWMCADNLGNRHTYKNGFSRHTDVTHWMPLPNPPKQ